MYIAFETEESDEWVVDDAFIAELNEICKEKEFTFDEHLKEMNEWKTNLFKQNKHMPPA